jgi:hypothetical protein
MPRHQPYSPIPATQSEERYADANSERASLRVILRTAPCIDAQGFPSQQVVAIEMPATMKKFSKGWHPPTARPMTYWDVSDIHGQATLSLRSDMDPAEVAARIATARSIHGPESTLPCCIARRSKSPPSLSPSGEPTHEP